MTVTRFLKTTSIPFSAIATQVRTHVSRVYQWRDGVSEPRGRHLARLIIVSGGAITVEAVAGRPLPTDLTIAETG